MLRLNAQGHLVISFSEVLTFQTCKRKYWYRFGMNLAPIEEAVAMRTGANGHTLLQSFYEGLQNGLTKDESIEAVAEKAHKLTRDKFVDITIVKAWALVDNFIKANDFTAEAILVENRFLVPASRFITNPDPEVDWDKIQIGFTPDVVLRRKGNFLDVEDAKFVGRAWSQKKLNRFPQTKLYHIFLEEMNYKVSRTLIRFFNTTTGDVSAYPYELGKAERVNLISDFMEAVREVYLYRIQDPLAATYAPRTMVYNTCQYCEFEELCSTQAQGKDATLLIANQFVESDYDYNR